LTVTGGQVAALPLDGELDLHTFDCHCAYAPALAREIEWASRRGSAAAPCYGAGPRVACSPWAGNYTFGRLALGIGRGRPSRRGPARSGPRAGGPSRSAMRQASGSRGPTQKCGLCATSQRWPSGSLK
jgi:hypothetical protein